MGLLEGYKKGELIEQATEAMNNTDHNWHEAFTEISRAQTTTIFVAKLLPDNTLEGRLIEPEQDSTVGAWLWRMYHSGDGDRPVNMPPDDYIEDFLKLVLGASEPAREPIDEERAAQEGARFAYVFDPEEPSTMYWYQYVDEGWVEIEAIDLGGFQPDFQPDFEAMEQQDEEENA